VNGPGTRSRIASPEPERVDGSLQLATVPNLISLVRALFLVPILWLLQQNEPRADVWAVVLGLVAGATDLIDGWVARSRGAGSPSGKVVDPVADKILIGGLVIYLAVARDFPWWILIALLARDALLVGGALLWFRRERVVFAADWTGKLTTFTMGWLIIAHVLRIEAAYVPLAAVAGVLIALSYASYGSRGIRFVREVRRRG